MTHTKYVDEIISHICYRYRPHDEWINRGEYAEYSINVPIIDVVEIVRCKGCKRWYSDGHIQWCKEWKHGTSENGYCHKADPIEREVEK